MTNIEGGADELRQPSDLVRQSHLLVQEAELLWALTEEVTDYQDAGDRLTHGPWRAPDCAKVLLRWFDAGLIECIAALWSTDIDSRESRRIDYDTSWRPRAVERGGVLVLARDDARALLTDPGCWQPEGIAAAVMVVASERAERAPFERWFDALTGLPEELIFAQETGSDPSRRPRLNLPEPVQVPIARRWITALNGAVPGRPLRCPVNLDAELEIDFDPSPNPEVRSGSVHDIVVLIGFDEDFSLPFGRHRLHCPCCGAQQYLVVRRRSGR